MCNAFLPQQMSFCVSVGPFSLRGRGKHHPVHHQRATEPRSGSSPGRPQQPRRSRRALCAQVQQPVCRRKLLRSRKSCCQCTKGIHSVTVESVDSCQDIVWKSVQHSTWEVFFKGGILLCHASTFCHLCRLRVSCEPQTPFVVSRVFQPSLARPPRCCSTLASCWTRAS